ncbi:MULTISPECIES: hypothetical protein [Cupriavidus]|uniref:Uncharacterized protein n=1 Tax=Cupriavidus pinatubonensis (strain JMP 134 / LMG 1197) TaxID=264198 RepID=Q46P47_CUPPJ|nr:MULTISPECIES: hypothetical protein [Cupriavidus]QYY29521.1 hypothetical protein K2O51_04840 [Cupriavidus pinatubonensis]TPQ44209.1 hypothetical protein C2U69_01320 [Cupriavidus pinatubonensis]
MIHPDTGATFRGLPLTAEQDSEVRHYRSRKTRPGKPWDTAELRGMLEDMLLPPKAEEGGQEDVLLGRSAAAERAASFVDEAMDPIAAYEDWNAALEIEGMTGEVR